MSLDNIQLPAFIIQDLFQKSLVDLSGNEPKKAGKSDSLNYFGGNNQHITLLVNTPDAGFVTDKQLSFLSGILTACKLTLEDIAIVNNSSLPSLSYKFLAENLNPRIVLLFGVSPQTIDLPFLIPDFQPQSYNNQVYLSIPSLDDLESNKELKRKLWVVLQQIFSL